MKHMLMVPDNAIYTDGRDVVVTDSMLKVKNSLYTLSGVKGHGLSTIQPDRIPGWTLIAFGVTLALTSLFNVLPASWIFITDIHGAEISSRAIFTWGGIVLASLGLNINLMKKKRYAVRLATIGGEKDVVVSSRKEYIAQIVSALDQAMIPEASVQREML